MQKARHSYLLLQPLRDVGPDEPATTADANLDDTVGPSLLRVGFLELRRHVRHVLDGQRIVQGKSTFNLP